MGQAKRRGTFETRMAQAVARNEWLKGHITDKPVLEKYAQAHGIQRLATQLTMSQLLSVKISNQLQTCAPPENHSH